MRNRTVGLFLSVLLVTGCAGSETKMGAGPSSSAGTAAPVVTTPPVAAPAGAPAQVPPSANTSASPPVSASGSSGSAAAPKPPPAAANPGSAAASGAPAPAPGSGMVNPGAAGAGATGPAPGGGLATEPVIPPVMGECPNFDSGSGTVMGARLSFLAAKKSEGKGSLVFYWHGTGSSPVEGSMFSGMADIKKDGGLVVGFSSGTGSGGDCSGTGTHSINDFKAADQVVACSVANYGVDPKRIYATGCSAGGLQTGCMSINRSAYIAAVATNSGGVTIGYGPFQDLTRVPNVMTMHGAPGGDVVIVDFSQTSEAYDNFMLAKGAFALECNHGGGHCGAPAALQASAWQFMKDHPFGTHPSPYVAGGVPMSFPKYCKAWTMTDRKPLGGDGNGTKAAP
jgi:hypothetical protein